MRSTGWSWECIISSLLICIYTITFFFFRPDTERRKTFKMRTQTNEENIEAIDSSSEDEDDVDQAPKAKKPKVVKFWKINEAPNSEKNNKG